VLSAVTRPRLRRSVGVTMRAGIVILGLAVLAGCGGDERGSASPDASAKLPAPLTFQVSGGLKLRLDKITIQPDGSAQVKTIAGEKPVELTDGELAKVVDALEQSGLETVPENSRSPSPIPDAFGYRFVYKGRQVDTDQESNPERLQALTATLTHLVDRYGPK
jgi:hypothetical protein